MAEQRPDPNLLQRLGAALGLGASAPEPSEPPVVAPTLPPIAIDGKAYPCDKWELVEQGERLEQVWNQGFPNGISDFTFRSPVRYRSASRMDTTAPPYIRLGLGLTATISTPALDTTQPAYAFTAKSADGSVFAYIINDRRAHKIRLTNSTAETVHDFGAGAVVGRWALFEGEYYVGLGTSVNARKLATVGNPGVADTWTDTGELALHYANDTQDGIARLARAHSVNQISFSPSGASGSWGGGFEVGDSSLPILDLLSWINELAVITSANVFRFDNDGNSFPVQDFVGRTASPSVQLTMSVAHGPFLYWMHHTGPWRIFEDVAQPIGPSSQPGWAHNIVDSLGPIGPSGWRSCATIGRWIYASVGAELVSGYIRDNGTVTWHGSFSKPGADPVFVMITEGNPATDRSILWAVDTDNIYRYTPLDNDGSTRTVIAADNRGKASEAARLVMPYTDMGVGINKLKQARMLWVQTENWPSSDIPLGLRLVRDHVGLAAVGVQIGADIEGEGYFERTLTPGTDDTFYEASMGLSATPSEGYSGADPLIRAFGMQAVTASVYRIVIPLMPDRIGGFTRGARGMLKDLRNLKNGATVKFRDPENPGVAFDGQIVSVAEEAVPVGVGQVGYIVQVHFERFDWAKGV